MEKYVVLIFALLRSVTNNKSALLYTGITPDEFLWEIRLRHDFPNANDPDALILSLLSWLFGI